MITPAESESLKILIGDAARGALKAGAASYLGKLGVRPEVLFVFKTNLFLDGGARQPPNAHIFKLCTEKAADLVSIKLILLLLTQ